MMKCLEGTRKAPNINKRLFNLNNTKDGVKVEIVGASGLPFSFAEMFCQCSLEIVGTKVQNPSKQLTKRVIPTSYQNHPKWGDKAFSMYPGTTDKSSAILIKIFGILCTNLKVDKSTFQFSFKKQPTLSADKPLGWGVCPLFDQDCVDAGLHVIPLFSGAPSEAFLQLMNSRGPTTVLIKFAIAKSIIKPLKTGAVLKLNVYDGIYEENEVFKEMKEEDERLIEPAGLKDKYQKITEEGPTLLQLMAPAFQDAKLAAPTKIQMKKSFESFETLMNNTFSKIK